MYANTERINRTNEQSYVWADKKGRKLHNSLVGVLFPFSRKRTPIHPMNPSMLPKDDGTVRRVSTKKEGYSIGEREEIEKREGGGVMGYGYRRPPSIIVHLLASSIHYAYAPTELLQSRGGRRQIEGRLLRTRIATTPRLHPHDDVHIPV